jgi:hypothetical protein
MRRATVGRVGAIAACASVSSLLAAQAFAFERQWHAGVDAGSATLSGQDAKSGFGGGAHAAYGLTDAFNALLEVDATRHPGASATVWSAGVGVAYTLDVTRAVPYAGLLVAAYDTTGANAVHFAPGGQLALGLDYQLERNWAIGVQLRAHAIVASPVLTYTTAFLRAENVWGF